jgi:hypothetical protein
MKMTYLLSDDVDILGFDRDPMLALPFNKLGGAGITVSSHQSAM